MPMKQQTSKEYTKSPSLQKAIALLTKAEDWLHIAVGVSLLLVALILLIYTLSHLTISLYNHQDVIHTLVKGIQDFLMVMIILEIFWTVMTYLKGRSVTVEPFLFIGIISSVRGIILLGTKVLEGHLTSKELLHFSVEIGVHSGEIFLLALALYLVRSSRVKLQLCRKDMAEEE
jgi:uncharacterized membrane protein (DUF373 family)